ncbi:MAG: hypothetical protein ACLQBB_01160, partial [Solirubrobacteraceae bacterium]
RTPSGAAAPVDGWSGTLAPGGAYDDYVKNTCAEGGALVAALGNATTHLAYTDRSTWAFEAPAYATLVNATLWRAGYVHGQAGEPAAYEFWLAGPLIKDAFDECVFTKECRSQGEPSEMNHGSNVLPVPARFLGSHLYVSASCGGGMEGSECGAGLADSNNYAAAVYIYAADLTLEQTAGPTVSNVGGELAGAPTISGTSDLTFDAADPGSGVFAAEFSVDGQVVQSTVIDEDGGRCRNVGQTTDGLPAFLYLQPCPPSVSADLGLDTTALSDGPHHLVVTVLDAAGNSASVLDRTVTVDNHGAAGSTGGQPAGGTGAPSATPAAASNGVGASSVALLSARWLGTSGARLTTSYGKHETIVGRLTGIADAPIAAAQIDVTATPALAGAAAVAMKATRTDADGYFRLTLPAGLSSRAVHLVYDARLGEPQPAAATTLQLSVLAPLSLTITPRTARVGSTIRFGGRLLAGPIPRGGKPVILEARSGHGSWIEFQVIRTDSRGRFHSSYRFKFAGPASYQFRVLCEQEADYPFATGASPIVSVRER